MSELRTRHGGLWVRTFGLEPARVVALHGFTLHGGMYEGLAAASNLTIAAPDLPGHGRTTVAPVTMRTAVDAIADLLARHDKPLLLGYSQGGRVALHVSLAYPKLVGSLILISTSPGLGERARAMRRAADDGLADRIERIGTERFITEWLANPLVATDDVDRQLREADRAMRMENSAAGLAAALRGIGQAAVADSSERISDLQMPTVFMAGSEDPAYCDHATAMAESCGERPVLIEGAGHNVVLEATDAVAAVMRRLVG